MTANIQDNIGAIKELFIRVAIAAIPRPTIHRGQPAKSRHLKYAIGAGI